MDTLHKKLNYIQTNLVAPKGQYNSFGKYKYRSCEDILLALKPLMKKTETTITFEDGLEQVGDRVYIVATVIFSDGENEVRRKAMARESESKKGMDASQITGAASSYARKYALNGLFAIDDTKDADTMKPNGSNEKITDKQVSTLLDGINNFGLSEDDVCKRLGIDELRVLPASKFKQAVSLIKGLKGEERK